jgi:uncharacterized protein YggU (UPF0235/DUF167 family)
MAERITIEVRVIPRSKVDRVGGLRAGRLVVRVAAAPESGAANRAAAALLASARGLSAAEVQLDRGSTSRDKSFSIPTSAQGALTGLFK